MKGYLLAVLLGSLVVAYGELDTNKTGVVILSKPVVVVYMEPNTTNTLWFRETLMDEWKRTMFLRDWVVSTNRQRISVESSFWDEDEKTGFFWLQVNGDTNMPIGTVSVVTNSAPAVPGG